MRYCIIILFWIIFLSSCFLYQNEFFLENKIEYSSESLIYVQNEDLILNIDALPEYDNIEYFYTLEIPTGQKFILANDVYYENMNLIPPKDGEYYGSKKLEAVGELQSVGAGPYINLFKNTYYLNLDQYDGHILPQIGYLNFRSEDKEKIYHIQKYAAEHGIVNGDATSYKLSSSYYFFFTIVNFFFILLTFTFLFIDINLYNKEIAINKILGYSLVENLRPVVKKQAIYSMIYFLALLIPAGVIIYDGSLEATQFFKMILLGIIIFYLISNLIYLVSFIYVIKKKNVVLILKEKKDSSLINSVTMLSNIISKIIIVLVLVILVVPSYQIVRVYNQYKNYIKGNEDYVQLKLPMGMDEQEVNFLYEKYNEQGAVINTRIGNSIGYVDSQNFKTEEQITLVNYNYMKLIGKAEGLDENKNYLLVPKSMENSIQEIEASVEDMYLTGDYELKYYENQEMYTYKPFNYFSTGGYIYYPIIVVVSDLSQTYQDNYIMNNMYYESSSQSDAEEKLTNEFLPYAKIQMKYFVLLLVLFFLFVILVVVSTYYMVKSYIEINGKEIAIKRILGYSRFKIYKQFYLLDYIYYVFGTIFILVFTSLFIMPLWFDMVFIILMILLNEINRKLLINIVEKNKIVNVLKGEI